MRPALAFLIGAGGGSLLLGAGVWAWRQGAHQEETTRQAVGLLAMLSDQQARCYDLRGGVAAVWRDATDEPSVAVARFIGAGDGTEKMVKVKAAAPFLEEAAASLECDPTLRELFVTATVATQRLCEISLDPGGYSLLSFQEATQKYNSEAIDALAKIRLSGVTANLPLSLPLAYSSSLGKAATELQESRARYEKKRAEEEAKSQREAFARGAPVIFVAEQPSEGPDYLLKVGIRNPSDEPITAHVLAVAAGPNKSVTFEEDYTLDAGEASVYTITFFRLRSHGSPITPSVQVVDNLGRTALVVSQDEW